MRRSCEEMRRDPKVFVSEKDVGPYGGAFALPGDYRGVLGRRGCFDTPISESAIVGGALARRLRGYRQSRKCSLPIFISCAFDQIVNQAATLRYRTAVVPVWPIVIRARDGGNVSGGLYHSQNPEAWFVHRADSRSSRPPHRMMPRCC